MVTSSHVPAQFLTIFSDSGPLTVDAYEFWIGSWGLTPLSPLDPDNNPTIAEFEAAKKRAEVATLDEIERQLTNAAIEIRTRLSQIPTRVAPMILGLESHVEVKTILTEEIEQALTALADGFSGG